MGDRPKDEGVTVDSGDGTHSRLQLMTLVVPVVTNKVEKRVILGLKKKGLGEGKWNGFGGKVEKTDRNIYEAAVRELHEETGVKVDLEDLEKRGVLRFLLDYENDFRALEVHVFRLNLEYGREKEFKDSDEMTPCVFVEHKIPYMAMWPDDPYWLPALLREGDSFHGTMSFQFPSGDPNKPELVAGNITVKIRSGGPVAFV